MLAGQAPILAMLFIIGVGRTVTVKFVGVPGQRFEDTGVTIIVPVISAPVELTGAVHDGILPVPDDPNPIAVFEFVHV